MKIIKNQYFILLCCAILGSLMMQIPDLVGNGLIKISSLIVWMIFFIILVINSKIKINISVFWIFFNYFLFTFYIFLLYMLTGKDYLGAIGVYPLNLSIFIFFIGYLMSAKISKKKLSFSLILYASFSTFITLMIFNQIKSGISADGNFGYLYSEKNSISTIALIAIILFLFNINQCSKVTKGIIILVCVFLTYCIFILKSRATIFGALGALITFLFFNNLKFNKKIKIWFLVCIAFYITVTNETLYSLIVEKLIFNKMDYTRNYTIDIMTSGRAQHLEVFLNEYYKNSLFGVGNYWLESFPLASLMQFGLIGSIPLFNIALYPILWCFKKILFRKEQKNSMIILVFIISTIFFLNCLFEAAAPFGPGAKCFILWLLFGYIVGQENGIKEN